GVMLQSSARITALLILLSAGIAIPAAAAPPAKGGGGPPGHAAPPAAAPHAAPPAAAPHAAPAARAAPAPHAPPAPPPTAPKAAPAAQVARAARQPHAPSQASTPRAAPPSARAARQQPAQPAGGSRAAARKATPQAAPTAAQQQPQTTGRNRDTREQPNLAQPKSGGDAARQPREGGAGAGPAARIDRNASPQNAPPQPQAAQQSQSAGGRQAIARGVLRNPTFANRSAVPDPNARSLARATFQGRFFDPGWRRRYSHPIVIGWARPLFWPYALTHFAGFTLSPLRLSRVRPLRLRRGLRGHVGLLRPRLRRHLCPQL